MKNQKSKKFKSRDWSRILLFLYIFVQALLLISSFIGLYFERLSISQVFSTVTIIFASVGTGLVAVYTLGRNIKQNILRDTIEKVDVGFPIRDEVYAAAINKMMTSLRSRADPTGMPSFLELEQAIEELSTAERKKIKEIVNYYNDIARGLRHGAYDPEWVASSLSGVQITIWHETWPFILWHRELDIRTAKGHKITDISGFTPMYTSYELWVEDIVGSSSVYIIPEEQSIQHTVKLVGYKKSAERPKRPQKKSAAAHDIEKMG